MGQEKSIYIACLILTLYMYNNYGSKTVMLPSIHVFLMNLVPSDKRDK